MTAYSAMSWPWSSAHRQRKVLMFIYLSLLKSVSTVCSRKRKNTSAKSSRVLRKARGGVRSE
jgi:hypothetical protein